jgi:hypothetical protein
MFARQIAHRIADERLSKHCRTAMWFIGPSYALSSLILFISTYVWPIGVARASAPRIVPVASGRQNGHTEIWP